MSFSDDLALGLADLLETGGYTATCHPKGDFPRDIRWLPAASDSHRYQGADSFGQTKAIKVAASELAGLTMTQGARLTMPAADVFGQIWEVEKASLDSSGRLWTICINRIK